MGKVKLKNVLKNIEIFELGDCSESSHPIDPVCHMQISDETKRFTYEYAGHTYHFCSSQCRDFFVADPLSFMSFSES